MATNPLRTFTRTGGNASFSMREFLSALSPKWRALGLLQHHEKPSFASTSLAHLASLTKRPQDSFVRVHLPLSTSQPLRETMLNARGYLRVGRLLEELDSFAGVLAQLHCDDGDVASAPPLLVTAAFDRIDVLSDNQPIGADRDLILEGCVSFCGRSSLNIAIDVLPAEGAAASPILQANTTFVARDAAGRAVGVPALAPATPLEAALWEAGRRAQEERRLKSTASLLKVPPTTAELAAVHSKFLETVGSGGGGGGAGAGAWATPRASGRGRVTTESTRLSSTHVTHPQDKNVYGRVFGGHLMRLAYETAWACGWRATAHAPRFLGMSDVLFRRPVEVGELLTITAEVGFSEGAVFTVLVDIEQERPGAGGFAPAVSNQLSFLFRMEDDGHPAPTFYPESYSSSMKWVAGARQLREGQLRRLPEAAAARFPQF